VDLSFGANGHEDGDRIVLKRSKWDDSRRGSKRTKS